MSNEKQPSMNDLIAEQVKHLVDGTNKIQMEAGFPMTKSADDVDEIISIVEGQIASNNKKEDEAMMDIVKQVYAAGYLRAAAECHNVTLGELIENLEAEHESDTKPC